MCSTTPVSADFGGLITWRLQFVTVCVKRLSQTDAMPCFQGSAEPSCFVSLKCQEESLFSYHPLSNLVCVYLFQTSAILTSASVWTLCRILNETCDLRKLEFISAVGTFGEK